MSPLPCRSVRTFTFNSPTLSIVSPPGPTDASALTSHSGTCRYIVIDSRPAAEHRAHIPFMKTKHMLLSRIADFRKETGMHRRPAGTLSHTMSEQRKQTDPNGRTEVKRTFPVHKKHDSDMCRLTTHLVRFQELTFQKPQGPSVIL